MMENAEFSCALSRSDSEDGDRAGVACYFRPKSGRNISGDIGKGLILYDTSDFELRVADFR